MARRLQAPVVFEDAPFAEAAKSFTAARFQGDAKLLAALNRKRLIRKGQKGKHVETVQQALVELGYELPKHGVDGDFGSETRRAVKKFQSE